MRFAALTHDLAGTADDLSLGFAYNPASQVTVRTASNDNYLWTNHYNVARPYVANGLNQYTTSGERGLAYDANGNLTSDGAIAFGYDAENRWVSARGAKSLDLAYDPLGRLARTSGGSAGATGFLYDGDELVAEYDGSGGLLRRYVHGTGVDDPIVWYEGSGLSDRRHLFADHQGSVVATANAAGTRPAINAYGAYGEPSRTHTGRFGYTGQIHIPEVGLWHYKARAYSPHLGRFLQTDPIGYDDQTNLYAYVGNDPVNMTDPTGLTAQANDEIVVIGGRRRAPSRMIGLTLFSRSVNVGLNLVSYAVTAQPLADGTFCNGKAPCVLMNKPSGNQEAVDEAIDDIVKDGDDISHPGAADTNIDVSGKGRSAERDLDAISKAAGKSVESKGGGVKVAELPDGRKAVLYPASRSFGRPTIQIQGGEKGIKIRY